MTQKVKQDITKIGSGNGFKKIVILDDDRDITATFKTILESDLISKHNVALRYRVYTSNSPEQFLSDFEPGSYDLLLIDINMPGMDGFEISKKLLQKDLNVRVCFMTAGEINMDAAREVHPLKSIGCFIKKPITAEELLKRSRAELE